jgi:phenylacetate-CoA ligase
MDYSVIEFLPTEYSDLFKIVGTTLHNAAMPLIRYDTNDLARISHRSCSCGRAFPVIDSIEGRLEDYIATPAGKFIGGMGIAFGGVANIIEGQIIQEKLDLIRVLIVPTEKFNDKDRNVLLKNMRERLGDDIEIIIQQVESIPRTKAGKINLTVSKLKPMNHTANIL